MISDKVVEAANSQDLSFLPSTGCVLKFPKRHKMWRKVGGQNRASARHEGVRQNCIYQRPKDDHLRSGVHRNWIPHRTGESMLTDMFAMSIYLIRKKEGFLNDSRGRTTSYPIHIESLSTSITYLDTCICVLFSIISEVDLPSTRITRRQTTQSRDSSFHIEDPDVDEEWGPDSEFLRHLEYRLEGEGRAPSLHSSVEAELLTYRRRKTLRTMHGFGRLRLLPWMERKQLLS